MTCTRYVLLAVILLWRVYVLISLARIATEMRLILRRPSGSQQPATIMNYYSRFYVLWYAAVYAGILAAGIQLLRKNGGPHVALSPRDFCLG